MTRKVWHALMAAGLLGLAACKESTSPSATLYNDATLTKDVAVTSGDAMATTVDVMLGNETAAAMPASGASFDLFHANSLSISRTRTCYDSTGAVVAACSPISAVRKIITNSTVTGSRSVTDTVTGGTVLSFSGAIHRVGTDTIFRNFTSGTETSRTHSGLQTSHDTSSFTNGTVSRTHDETAIDSVRGVTWDLPRLTNPFPVSGYIVRVDSIHATFTSATTSETRDVVRTVKITFPPDAQGNVVLQINGKTCTLNLVTHAVTNCS